MEAIDERVKTAVRAWAAHDRPEKAGSALGEHRRALPAELMPQLVAEVAEISAELVVRLLERTDGLEPPDAEPVELEGLRLHPKQAERLAAWGEDQTHTVKALGLSSEAWIKAFDAAFVRLQARLGAESEAAAEEAGTLSDRSDDAAKAAAARRMLGAGAPRFENRPPPGNSPRAGLSGLLAAREFGKKP